MFCLKRNLNFSWQLFYGFTTSARVQQFIRLKGRQGKIFVRKKPIVREDRN